MTDQQKNAPRRYFVDARGNRVLIGLSLEETREFESVENGLAGLGEGGRMTEASDSRASPARRWFELYAKHDEAWKAWIVQSRAEQAASLTFVNHS